MKRLFQLTYKRIFAGFTGHHWRVLAVAMIIAYGVGFAGGRLPDTAPARYVQPPDESQGRAAPSPVKPSPTPTPTPEPPGALSYVKPEPVPTPYNRRLNESFAAFLNGERTKTKTAKPAPTPNAISEADAGGASTREFAQLDGTSWTVDKTDFPSAGNVKPVTRKPTPAPAP